MTFSRPALNCDATLCAGLCLCIHWNRSSEASAARQEIRAQDPPHYADIFELDLQNLKTKKPPQSVAASVVSYNERMIEREGRAEIQEILDDIRRDRERSYARLMPLF